MKEARFLNQVDMKFILLHEGKNDEGIRAFFMDVWELYIKVGLFVDDAVDKEMLTRKLWCRRC